MGGFGAAFRLVEQRADGDAAADIGSARADGAGALSGVEVRPHFVDGHAHAAEGEAMAADGGNGIADGLHFRKHIALDAQRAIAAEAGAAAYGGGGLGGVARAFHDASAQAARRAGLRVGVDGVGVAHGDVADAAPPFPGPEQGGEGAGGVRDHFHDGDVDEAKAAGLVDTGAGNGGGVVEYLDRAGDVEGRARNDGPGGDGDLRLGEVAIAAHQRDVSTAVAAHRRAGGGIVFVGVLVEAGDHLQSRAPDVAALDDGLVRAGDIARGAVDGDAHAFDVYVDALYIGKSARRGRGGDGDVARGGEVARRDGNAAARGRSDACAGGGVVFGVGNVGVHGGNAEGDTVARLPGDGLGVGIVGGVDVDIARGDAAGGNGLEVALGVGFQHVDADAGQIERAVLALDGGQRVGVAQREEFKVARERQRGAVDEGVVGGVGAGDGGVGPGRDHAGFHGSAVRAEVGLGHGGLAAVEFGVDARALGGEAHILRHGRLRGADFRQHHVGGNGGDTCVDIRLAHDGLGQRFAIGENLDIARRERALTAEPGVGGAGGVGDGDVDGQIVEVYREAGRRGHEVHIGVGGVVRADGNVADAVFFGAVGQFDTRVEAALRVAEGNHGRGGDVAAVLLVVDLRLGVRVAGGGDVQIAGGGERRRAEQRRGGGAAVGDGHIGARVEQCAAAGVHRGGGGDAIILIEGGADGDVARLHVGAVQFGALLVSKHRDHHGSGHAGSADVEAGQLREGRGLAVGKDGERVAGDERAVSEDGGDVARVVVGDGGVHAHVDGARASGDRLGAGLGAVPRVFAAGVDFDDVGDDGHALGVDDGAVVRAQVDVADRDADRNAADGAGGEEGLGLHGVVGVDGDARRFDIGAADAGHAARLVKDQQHVAVHGDARTRAR